MMKLIAWDKIKNQIESAQDVEVLVKMENKLKAMQVWARQEKASLETQNSIAEYKLRCARKIGEFSKELPTHERIRTDLTAHHRGEQLTTKTSILKDAGVEHSERYEAIASLPADVFEEHIQEIQT